MAGPGQVQKPLVLGHHVSMAGPGQVQKPLVLGRAMASPMTVAYLPTSIRMLGPTRLIRSPECSPHFKDMRAVDAYLRAEGLGKDDLIKRVGPNILIDVGKYATVIGEA